MIKLRLELILITVMFFTSYMVKAQTDGKSPNAVEQTNVQRVETLSGVVIDQKGYPIIGATVQIKNTLQGTTTDAQGRFQLKSAVNGFVSFTSIGYVAKEVSAAALKNATIVLDELTQSIDDVVVVGFGTQKKSNLTGAVSTIGAEVFKDRPVQNAAQALMGVSPGLNISQGTGFLETEPDMNIRGMTTIGEGSNGGPLVLIDGMPGKLTTLNPQSIESISVLKDAAAASIYGSRAAFGVIMVTTKKGEKEKFSVNYNNSFRWNMPVNMPHMADSYSFAIFANDFDPWTGWFNEEHLARIKAYQEGTLKTPIHVSPDGQAYTYYSENANTDWYDVLFRDVASSQEHTVSVSGGSDKLQMYASLNNLDQGGLSEFNQDRYGRLAATLKVDARIWNFIDITYDTRFTRINNSRPTYLGNPATEWDTFFAIGRQSWPTFPLYDNNGHIYSSGLTGPKAGLIQDGGTSRTKTTDNTQQLKLRIEPIKNWEIVGSINYTGSYIRGHEELFAVHAYDAAGNRYTPNDTKDSHIWESSYGSDYIGYDLYSSYSFNIKNHAIKVMAGMQTEQFATDDFLAFRNGIIVNSIPYIDMTTGVDPAGKKIPPTVNGGADKWTTAGFFGRLNYSFKDKYLFEANLRYDGSSRFRRDSRWVLSPSFSAGYNLAKEEFWKPISSLISLLKIRGSYGSLANQNTYLWYPTYVTQPLGTNNSGWLMNGIQQNTASSPGLVSDDLTWEQVKTVDVGLDVSMLDNRLSATFDYYVRDTKDMVGPAPVLPSILGVDPPKMNNTSLRTRGWELSVGWQDRLKCGFTYHVSLALSDDQTEITEYPSSSRGIAWNAYYPGKKVGEIWGLTTIGIAKTQEEMDKYLASMNNGGQDAIGVPAWGWTAGDIMYKDINGDGKISWEDATEDNPGDMKVIGNYTPRYRYSINLGASYKGFDFSAFLQGVGKRDYDPGAASSTFFGAGADLWSSQMLVQHKDYFRADPNHPLGQNLDAYYPRPQVWSTQNTYTQTRFLQNAAYLRLKNIQIGYTFPNKWVSKARMSNLRVYLSGENLLTFTKLSDIYDPETVYNGYGGTGYPILKTYSCGLSINF